MERVPLLEEDRKRKEDIFPGDLDRIEELDEWPESKLSYYKSLELRMNQHITQVINQAF